jgi:plastocyanin
MNKNNKFLTTSITIVATTVLLLLLVWPLTSPPTTITNALTITPTINVPVSANRVIYLFNSHIPDVNESKLGIPTDLFTPSSIIVNKGDNVTIHFYNTDKGEPHTFTIGAPYNIDKNVPAEQNATIVLKANHAGIFQYYCKYHLPTMQGQLIVTR